MGGVCVDALNPAGCPSADTILATGADGVRLVAFDDDRFFTYARDLAVSMRVAVVLARESFDDDDFGGWTTYYADRVTPYYWILGNEPDAGLLPVESPSSWKMRPAEYAAFWNACAYSLLQIQPQARLVVAGLVSGQPSYAYEVATLLDPAPYAYDIHPYGRDSESARELLHMYQEALG